MAMTLRLTEEDNARLDELAEAEGRSKQEVLRLALADRWARLHKQEVLRLALADRWARLHKQEQLDEVLGRVLPRYRGLLDRMDPV